MLQNILKETILFVGSSHCFEGESVFFLIGILTVLSILHFVTFPVWRHFIRLLLNATYLFLLLVEVVDDDTDEEVEGEKGAKDDEDDKVEVHVQVDFILRLVFHLKQARWNRMS